MDAAVPGATAHGPSWLPRQINTVALIMLGILVVQSAGSYFHSTTMTRVGQSALADLRRDTYGRLICLPMLFFGQRRVGELNSRLAADLTQIEATLIMVVPQFLRQTLMLLGGIILIASTSARLTLIMLSAVPPVIVLAVVFGRRLRQNSREAQDKLAETGTIVEETLQGIFNVKAFVNEGFEIGRYGRSMDDYLRVALRGARLRGAFIAFIRMQKGLSGWRCGACGEVEFDAESARRYAAAGDALVLRARERQRKEIRRIRRKLGLSQPIAVVPNGVKLPPSAGPQDYATTRLRTRERTALFLSRIHPSKGLLDLVQAWAALAPVGWRVTIAGGDENGYRAEVEAAVRKANVQADFDFIGEVTDGPKWELYRKADVFVLPTRSENFGIVVAEALASGLPVITTREAPWGQLQTHGCCWWVSVGVEPLVVALREAISLSDEQRREMGARGRKLIEDNYTWPSAAAS